MLSYMKYGLLFALASVNSVCAQTDSAKIFLASNVHLTKSFESTEKNRAVENREQKEDQTIFNQEYLTGYWGGYRNNLTQNGINFGFGYKADYFQNISGGNQKQSALLDNVDLILELNLEKSIGLQNSNLLIQFLGNSGEAPSELGGVSMGISNIETIPAWKLYQLIFEKRYFNENLSIAVGLYDFNSEFDTRESSGLFINPSHGIGDDIAKSGVNGPSIFPTTSAALRIKYQNESFYFLSAVMDGVPGNIENPNGTHIIFGKEDGIFTAVEAGLFYNIENKVDYKLAAGLWSYSTKFINNNFVGRDPIYASEFERNFGLYLTAEKTLLPNLSDKDISIFARIGAANKNVNPVDYFIGTGVKFSGFSGVNNDDEFGFAIAWAHNSDAYRNALLIENGCELKSYELNLELTYQLRLTPWIQIQPDLQYIINPTYCEAQNSTLFIGSRVILLF